MEHVRRLRGDSSNPRRLHGGPAAGVMNTPRLRGDVIGEFCRFSENELKNERAVYVVHSEWLLVHSDIILE